MTATLAGSLVVLALIDSTSFGTLLIPLWFLAAPGRVRAGRVVFFLATVAATYLLVGLALLAGAGALVAAVGDLAQRPAVAWAQLVLGGAVLLVGVLAPRRAGSGSGRVAAWRERALGGGGAATGSRGGRVGLVTLSVTAVALELPTMLPYLTATALLAATELGALPRVAALAVYCVVMVVPALVLLAVRVLARRWAEPALTRLARWVERGSGDTLAWVVAIVGFLLARDAASRLPALSWWFSGITGG